MCLACRGRFRMGRVVPKNNLGWVVHDACCSRRRQQLGQLRGASGGARRGLMLWRSALRSDSTALLGPGSRRRTRYVRCAHFAQTAAASQMWMRAARAEPGPVLLVATEIAPTGHRLPRCTSGSFCGRQPGVAAKARSGRLQRASGAPSSAGLATPARSADQPLTCRRLFERSERSERSEFGGGPQDRAAQGSQSEAQTAPAKRCGLSERAFAAPTLKRTNHHSPPKPARSQSI
jgi:hypothetical protein